MRLEHELPGETVITSWLQTLSIAEPWEVIFIGSWFI